MKFVLSLMPSAETMQPERWRIAAAFAAVYIIWGSTYLAIRFAVQTIPPFLMAGFRFLLSGAILYAWASLRGSPRPKLVHWKEAAIVGGLLMFGGNGGVSWAEQKVPSGVAALIISTVPIWMILIDSLHNRSRWPSAATVLGVGMGFAGVGILIGSGQITGNPIDPVGALVLLAAALCWTSGSLYSRSARLPDSQISATALEMLMGGAILLAAATVTREWGQLQLNKISELSAASFVYLTLFGSLIGFTAYLWLLHVTTPARASTYAYVNPVVAVLLGWALAGEALTAYTILAAAIILASVAIVTLRKD